MDHVVPPSLLFDFQLPIPTCPKPPNRKTGRLLKLPESARLFVPSVMNERPVFADLRAAWNTDGFAFTVQVTGRTKPVAGSTKDIRRSDCVLLWIDTRPSGNVHRATEYCHHFACLPADDQNDAGPQIVAQPIAQQRTRRSESDPGTILSRTHQKKESYEMEVWIPASQLYGFREIADIGKLGFYCVVQDTELGEHHLTVGDDFPYSYDPSTWLQLELTS